MSNAQDDRELLELAAKAAGEWDYKNDCIGRPWSPLTDDGDALRLAVKLGLLLGIHWDEVWAQKYMGEEAGWLTIKEPLGGCRFAATRRAIVRAAAEIQRAKGVE